LIFFNYYILCKNDRISQNTDIVLGDQKALTHLSAIFVCFYWVTSFLKAGFGRESVWLEVSTQAKIAY